MIDRARLDEAVRLLHPHVHRDSGPRQAGLKASDHLQPAPASTMSTSSTASCATSATTPSPTSVDHLPEHRRSSWSCCATSPTSCAAIGLADAAIDEYGYVMATIPATTHEAGVPTIGFIAHVDTSPEMPGAGVKPIVHRDYDGRDLVLPDDPSAVLRLRRHPGARRSDRPRHRDRVGDDAARRRQQGRRRRNRDRGGVSRRASRDSARHDPDRLHAGRGSRPRHRAFRRRARSARACAYTMDGGSRGEIEIESFSADAMTVTFHGFNTHPGYAKGRMVNAIKVAADFIDRLPDDTLSPETTDGHEGFVHPYVVQASVERTSVQAAGPRLRDRRPETRKRSSNALARDSRARYPGRPRRGRRRRVVSQHAGGARSASGRSPTTRAKRSGAPARAARRIRFAAAPTARGCRSWGCRRRICSPASTTSTRGSSGCRCRTWRRRSR